MAYLHPRGRPRRTATTSRRSCRRTLGAALERHLDIYRPVFRNPKSTKALWLSRNGRALSKVQLCAAFKKAVKAATGIDISLHDVRDIAATTIAITKPDHVSVASDLLGHRDQKDHRTGLHPRAWHRGVQSHVEHNRKLAEERGQKGMINRGSDCNSFIEKQHGDSHRLSQDIIAIEQCSNNAVARIARRVREEHGNLTLGRPALAISCPCADRLGRRSYRHDERQSSTSFT